MSPQDAEGRDRRIINSRSIHGQCETQSQASKQNPEIEYSAGQERFLVGIMQKGFIEEVDPCLDFEGKVREWEVSHSRRKEELGGSWMAGHRGVVLGMCYLDETRQSHRERVRLVDLGAPHCISGNGSGTVYFNKASN